MHDHTRLATDYALVMIDEGCTPDLAVLIAVGEYELADEATVRAALRRTFH
ncbi:MAG: hypothetical protein AB7Q00_14745 [Phycisphaerales bacterium]